MLCIVTAIFNESQFEQFNLIQDYKYIIYYIFFARFNNNLK